MDIAVVIATKNRPELLLSRALKSVFSQTLLPTYVIIVDDSDESNKQINERSVKSFSTANTSLIYLYNQRTSGASGAWNSAIEYLSSEYKKSFNNLFLAFLDDDDEWHPSYLKDCLKRVKKTNCNMVAAGFLRYESSDIKKIECLPPISLEEANFLVGNPGIQGSNLFLSFSIMLMVGGFDEHLLSCTDRDLCIRLVDLGEVRYQSIQKCLLNHYAENCRQRLSNPSLSKNRALTAFWLKYHGRMSSTQRDAFIKRAHNLFGWVPAQHLQKDDISSMSIALTLGIELTEGAYDWARQVIDKTSVKGKQYLTGFNLVLSSAPNFNLSKCDIDNFVDYIRQKGISCFDVSRQKISVEEATALIASENIGHSAWVIHAKENRENGQKNLPYKEIETLLTVLGAAPICVKAFTKTPKTENILKQMRIDEAYLRIEKLFAITDLSILGMGSEAIVLTDGKHVFKIIDYWKTRLPDEQIRFLQESCGYWDGLLGLYSLESVTRDGTNIVITYLYEKSIPYLGGYQEQVIDLLHSCSKAGIVCNNIHPKNLIKTPTEVKLIDYGSDIRPWTDLGFEHMARRAYLTIYYAERTDLKSLMQQSLRTTNFPEMEGYEAFRQQLIGLDTNLKQTQHSHLAIPSPEEGVTPFTLVIGVITGDPNKLVPLINSIAELRSCRYLVQVKTIVLCNGCTAEEVRCAVSQSKRGFGCVEVIDENQQVLDAKQGVFGEGFAERHFGCVGIAHARSMIQKYVGLECQATPNSIAWILDDDMRLDERAKQYLAWLPIYKREGIDIIIGQYEGSSPNPPLNGLRGQLVDLLHNLRWLDTLPDNIKLPDRCLENEEHRAQYPDFYYDLSRKHLAHVEVPFWLEPAYEGETVAEARTRLFTHAPLIVTGFPLTRAIKSIGYSGNPLLTAQDTANRGGNTFILLPELLVKTPNLIPKVDGRELRRSDMIWAMINKYYYKASIKTAPFPVLHIGRVQDSGALSEETLNLNKVRDEILGSALYAGLQAFLSTNEEHNLAFKTAEIELIWLATKNACEKRLKHLQLSFYRILGLAHALSKYPELMDLCDYLKRSFTTEMFAKLTFQVKQLDKIHIDIFLNKIITKTDCFADAKHGEKKDYRCDELL